MTTDLAHFFWEGRDAHGRRVQGERQAPGIASLRWLLAEESIELTHAERTRPCALPPAARTLLFRQWATLLAAGVPLLQAVSITRSHLENPAAGRILDAISRQLQGGASLHDALARHPASFDALSLQLVAAGELSGRLDILLERLAEHGERMLALRDRLRTALFYPFLVVALALLLTGALLAFVIPTFADLYRDAGVVLPLPTRIVLILSDAVLDFGLPALFILAAGAVYLRHIWMRGGARDGKLRARLDRLLLRLPVLGPVVTRITLARWANTFATLFAAGVPLDQVLAAAAGAARNHAFAETLPALRAAVNAGQPLSRALAEAGIFTPIVIEMCAVGEESGALDTMLGRVALYYEREAGEAVARLSRLLEPVLMLVLGLIVGGIVIAMYLPVFRLGSVL